MAPGNTRERGSTHGRVSYGEGGRPGSSRRGEAGSARREAGVFQQESARLRLPDPISQEVSGSSVQGAGIRLGGVTGMAEV